MEKVKFNEKCSYEARLSAREWVEGSGYSTYWDVVESWDIKSASDLDFWMNGVKSGDKDIFDYVTDNCDEDELKTGEDSDNEWKIEIIETDEDDNEKVLAVTSIWESELRE